MASRKWISCRLVQPKVDGGAEIVEILVEFFKGFFPMGPDEDVINVVQVEEEHLEMKAKSAIIMLAVLWGNAGTHSCASD